MNRLEEFSENLSEQSLTKQDFISNGLNFEDKNDTFNFLLLFCTLNFTLWNKKGDWSIDDNGERVTRTKALYKVIYKLIEENSSENIVTILDNLSFARFKKILNGGKNFKFLKERHQYLQDLKVLLKNKYKSDPHKVIIEADFDAIKLLEIIVSEFPNFNDHAKYKKQEVFFLKRAQLLTSLIDLNITKLKNIDKLSAFADYRLPQLLRSFEILNYDYKLEKKVDLRQQIKKDSIEELEIRANTIYAIELIKQKLKKRGVSISSVEIDNYLWNLSQGSLVLNQPHHLTETTFY